MDIITLKQAREQGLTRYFDGSLCKRGNAGWRKTCDGSCLCADCKAHNNRVRAERKQARGDEFKALRCQEEKKRRERRGDELNAVRRERYETDFDYRQTVLERNTEWRATNREQADAIVRSWLSNNPGARKAYHAKRRAQLRGCLPVLTEQELKQIKAVYRLRTLLSRNSGVEYHVDHRIPLSRGGLHHPDNLWVIPATENLRKHNKLPEELVA